MSEVIIIYFIQLIFYPVTVVYYAFDDPSTFVTWFLLGAFMLYAVRSLKWNKLMKPLMALWFMPGTLICGSAALFPWPYVVLWYIQDFNNGYCVTVSDLFVTMLLNLVVVYFITHLVKLFYKKVKKI